MPVTDAIVPQSPPAIPNRAPSIDPYRDLTRSGYVVYWQVWNPDTERVIALPQARVGRYAGRCQATAAQDCVRVLVGASAVQLAPRAAVAPWSPDDSGFGVVPAGLIR